MSKPAKNRVWASLTDDEVAALDAVAEARGLRCADVVRAAILTYLRAPSEAVQTGVSPSADPAVMARLDALADKMERQTQALRIALDTAYASDIRTALNDVAMAIGVIAGSVEPADKGGPF